MSDITRLLDAAAAGDRRAAADLLPLVYDELRKLAAAHLVWEKPGQTLDATALVHEAYVRLAGEQRFENRRHFFVAAGEAMRRVLVDHARRKLSAKRGGLVQRLPLSDVAALDADERLLALDEALTQLATDDPLLARVVELHHFAGLSHDQVAAALDTTVYDVRQKWTFARAWLKAALEDF
ncbi:MAG TPA: ECF-type sigma factor [Gemmata sp.]|jgi:RNA polymerase sigma factor (TIGR02999 family)|nr:ECF-type sigma factor [Gemmata sp.]